MIDIGLPDTISFVTQSCFHRNVYGSDLRSKFSLMPSWSPLWDFKTLSIFLNEMHDFEPIDTKPTRNYKSTSSSYRTFKFHHKLIGDKYSIYIKIIPENNFSILVELSRNMITSKDYFKVITDKKNL